MDELERQQREKLLTVAKSYLGTPYRDCARVKGHGVDCGTLLALVFEEADLTPQIEITAYSPQWYLHNDVERYLDIILQHTDEIEEARAIAGDLVVYKFGRLFAHGAIIIEPGFPAIIHAYKQARAVIVGEGASGPLAMNKGQPRPRRFFRRKGWSG